MTKKKQKKLWLAVIFSQMAILIFMEGIRIIQEWDIQDTKPLVAFISGVITYLVAGIFKEFKNYKKP